MQQPEPWLRGPVPNIIPTLQPVAHMLMAAKEEIAHVTDGLSEDQLWAMPGGAASVGFHILHLAGATDRLVAYAFGEELTEAQRDELRAERDLAEPKPVLSRLVANLTTKIDSVLMRLTSVAEANLATPRTLGRAQLPTTMYGLLAHCGDHSQRHTGQIVTTVKFLRGQ